MHNVDYLIIGGGIAGTTAAEKIREQDSASTIHIVTAEHHQFYSRMMLSKPSFYLEKTPTEAVYVRPPEWFTEHHIDTTIGHGAASLDIVQKVVTLENGEQLQYKKLLLALGTGVRKWAVPGADKQNVLHLRTLDDAEQVTKAIKTTKHATIIGGGFIAFEMCNLFHAAGIPTSLILREKYFWEPLLDEISGKIIETALEKNGVRIMHETMVEEVLGDEAVSAVRLNSGQQMDTDLIIVGIGTECPLEWVSKAGVATHCGILADEYLATSAPDVWTAGDVAEYKDLILDENIQFGNWMNAHKQGEAAAINMLGQHQPFHDVSHYTAEAMGVSIAFAGDVRMMEGRKIVERGSPELGYTRMILRDGLVEGATMVNRPQDLAPLMKIIEQRKSVETSLKQLSDPMFDLQGLLT